MRSKNVFIIIFKKLMGKYFIKKPKIVKRINIINDYLALRAHNLKFFTNS